MQIQIYNCIVLMRLIGKGIIQKSISRFSNLHVCMLNIIIFISYVSMQGCVCIEVHQALGLKYQRLAISSVRLKDIIANSGGKVHGKAVLSGVESIGECVSVGTLDYWIKLKLPITQAIRLYQVSATIVQCHNNNMVIIIIL